MTIYFIPDILIINGFICVGLFLVMAWCETKEIEHIKSLFPDDFLDKYIRKRRFDFSFSAFDFVFSVTALVLRLMNYSPDIIIGTIIIMFAIHIFIGQMIIPTIWNICDLHRRRKESQSNA